MKNLILSFLLVFGGMSLSAQVKTPAPSPLCKIEQKVGLGEIHIEYSRPSKKDRIIFGGLVPYDKHWRTGANRGTKITFSEDVKIAGQDLAAGQYTLFTKPGKTSWDFIFYKDLKKNTPSDMKEEDIALTVSAKPETLPMMIETFTINVGELRNSSCLIELLWDNVWVAVPVSLSTGEAVQASIDKTWAGPSAGDYYSAAVWYYTENIDQDKALEWVNKSIEMRPDKFWMYHQKAKIQAKLKDYKGAIETAKRSKELAMEADNQQYVGFNESLISEWMTK